MLKFTKITDKEIVLVQAQENCTVNGKSREYKGEGDCLDDCNQHDQTAYYKSVHH